MRPTSDRLRETLFNILSSHLRDSRFLDLCAGSGAIGIEAFSRGASEVVFVENSRRAATVIKENLALIGVKDHVQIIQRDAIAALQQLENAWRQFDIIYFDPPYTSEIYAPVLNQLAKGKLLAPDSIVIVEHRSKAPLEQACGDLKIYREVKQGVSALAFYSLAS